jgi:hypothetical protein
MCSDCCRRDFSPRHPKKTQSIRDPTKEMRDGEAFEAFLSDEMPRICNVTNYYIEFRGQKHRIEHVWYKWLRCELAHEASLPKDINFDPDPTHGVTRTAITEDGSLTLTHGWLDGLVSAVVSVPENADQFGTPPIMPIPIHLPKIDLWIGKSNPT